MPCIDIILRGNSKNGYSQFKPPHVRYLFFIIPYIITSDNLRLSIVIINAFIFLSYWLGFNFVCNICKFYV